MADAGNFALLQCVLVIGVTPEAAWMVKQGYKWTSSEEDIEESVPAAESDVEHEEQWNDFSA